MPKPRGIVVWIAVGLVLLSGLMTWGVIALRNMAGPAGKGAVSQVSLAVAELGSVPADVRDAADKLRSSKVGYAMVRDSKTYLIISTGSDDYRVRFVKAQGSPGKGQPTTIDVNLSKDVPGSRLLILRSVKAYQADVLFNVGAELAAIPTLHNPHNLPLVGLPEDQRFVVLEPVLGQLADHFPLRFAGYARVFEAQFSVTLQDAKGKELARAYVKAAAGAPGWGSFVGDVRPDVTQLPETGFMVFQGQEPSARLVIPVRFKVAGKPELG